MVVASHVVFAVQHATLAMAAVGLMMGLVRSSPVNREIKLMTRNVMIVVVIPHALPSAPITEFLLIIDSYSVVGTEYLLIVTFSSVSVTVAGGLMMGAVVCI